MRRPAVWIWIALCAAAVVVVVRAHYTADLSAFLPASPTAAQRFLVEQLREGPASQLILIGIEGADPTARISLSKNLAAALRRQPEFNRVVNGEPRDLAADQAFVFRNRYLLSSAVTPQRFTADGLREAIAAGIEDLSTTTGLFSRDLFLQDPTGETMQVLSQLGHSSAPPRTEEVWLSRDGSRALLMAQTRASGSDTDAQQHALSTIRRCFAELNAPDRAPGANAPVLRLTGPGVFAVDARSMIEHDAIRLSLLSGAIIVALLLLVYRSIRMLALGLLPVATGALAGIAAVQLGFGLVHGVTLGFGVTLIGEAVDYSVYLFIQSQASTSWTTRFWPTIRLGMLTSICGFASLLPSKFPGLAQLGLYSIAGLVAAALVTRFVLTELMPEHWRMSPAAASQRALLGEACARALTGLRRLRWGLLIIPVAAALSLYLHRDHLWNQELSALSPVPASAMALDGELRADLGAPDVRTLIVISAPSMQAALETAESTGKALDALIDSGVIAGYQNPADYLPSLRSQKQRQSALPDTSTLQSLLRSATASLPIRPERLAPFVSDVQKAREGSLIERADLKATSMDAGLDALLIRHQDRWNAIIPLEAVRHGTGTGTIDVAAVSRAVAASDAPGVEQIVLDLKAASDSMYASYLREAMHLSLAGFAGVVLLLLVSLRSPVRVLRVVAPLMLAVLAVIAGLAAAGVALTILHLIGLLLIVAIGSNYALFFERAPEEEPQDSGAPMRASLLVANLTAVIGFGALAFSSVPVLSALGSTVAPGAFLALCFSALMAREP